MMNLYFTYIGLQYETMYVDSALGYIKVVACPFCGVSTSSGEVLIDYMGHALFRCFTCQQAALSSNKTRLAIKKEVEKLYPHNFVADDVRSVELYKIVSVSRIPSFFATENVPNNDVIAFYNDLEKFGDENKVNVDCFIGISTANKFLKDNELAKKYNIKYSKDAENSYLSLYINDYNMSEMLLGRNMLVIFVDEKNNERSIITCFESEI